MHTDDDVVARQAIRRLADLAPTITLDTAPRAPSVHERREPKRAWTSRRLLVPLAAAAAVAGIALASQVAVSRFSTGPDQPAGGVASATSSPTASGKESTGLPVGAIAGENEDQAGLLRAAKLVEDDPKFAGVKLSDSQIVVYMVPGFAESTIDQARAALNPGDTLVVESVDRTLSELSAVNDKFNALFPKIREAGIQLGTSWIDTSHNVVIAETRDVDQLRSLLRANGLGDAPIEVRYSDSQPGQQLPMLPSPDAP